MKWRVIKSWLTLFSIDAMMRFRGFDALRGAILNEPLAPVGELKRWSREHLCQAMNLACVFYLRQLSSLELSAATTLTMRRHGWPAELVIGAQIVPYDTYAWVESAGTIMNDHSNLLELYQVLERC